MRLIDAEHFDVIAYSKDVDGYEDTFDDGVRWIAEQIDKADTVDAIQMKDWENLKQIIIDVQKNLWEDMGARVATEYILDAMNVIQVASD